MPENCPKKRSILVYLLYACAIILSVIILVGFEVIREDQVNECLHQAYQQEKVRWAHFCKETAKHEIAQFRNCIEGGRARARLIYSSAGDIENSDKQNLALCKSIYDDSDSSADCLLPKVLADSLNSRYEKSVEMCKS